MPRRVGRGKPRPPDSGTRRRGAPPAVTGSSPAQPRPDPAQRPASPACPPPAEEPRARCKLSLPPGTSREAGLSRYTLQPAGTEVPTGLNLSKLPQYQILTPPPPYPGPPPFSLSLLSCLVHLYALSKHLLALCGHFPLSFLLPTS